jgi:hypothetical protein
MNDNQIQTNHFLTGSILLLLLLSIATAMRADARIHSYAGSQPAPVTLTFTANQPANQPTNQPKQPIQSHALTTHHRTITSFDGGWFTASPIFFKRILKTEKISNISVYE